MVIQSLTISKKRKEMKKIFYILAAAIVALGTVACENEGLDNINPNINVDGDTVSFVAGINRTDLDGTATVWDADDTIVVTWNENNYEFKNAETGDKNTFKGSAPGLSAIVNAESIKAVYSNNQDGNVDSEAGVAGALLEYEGAFGNIAFEVKNAFLKFKANAGSEVKFTASKEIFSTGTELTLTATGEDQYVAVYPKTTTITYALDGVVCTTSEENTLKACKIYPLSNLEKVVVIKTKEDFLTFAEAVNNGTSYDGYTVKLNNNIDLEDAANTLSIVVKNNNINLDLNGKTLTAKNTRTATHNFFFDVNAGGVLTVENGSIVYTHTGTNMGWNGAATAFDVTGGGVLNMNGVNVTVSGTDMNFCVHLNNWGEVTFNADGCKFNATYCGVRVFNSGYDMNNVTIKNSKMTGATRAFWVQMYIGDSLSKPETHPNDARKARLNFDIFGNNNTYELSGEATSPVRYGQTASIYFNPENGNQVLGNATDLSRFAKYVNEGIENYKGKTVELVKDIELTEAWTPVGQTGATQFHGTFDGQGHTIKGLTINAPESYSTNYATGMFGWVETGAVIKNIVLDEANINGYHYVGAIAGYMSSSAKIEGCKVINSEIVADPTKKDTAGEFNGDKVGGIVGYTNGSNVISGNEVSKTTIKGYRHMGGIVGYLLGTAENNTVDDTVVITVNNDNNYKNYAIQSNYGVNNIAGVVTGSATNNNGEVTIVWGDIPATLVAKVGEHKYETFEAALAAAEAGSTIELLANVGDVTISKACVINAGKYTINITPGEGYGIMESSNNTYRIAKLSEWEISDGTRFYETETADLFVIKNVKLTANNFCLHKVGDTGWGAGAKYGLVNAGTKQVDTAIGVYSANWAGDITISSAKTDAHDIYFDKANSRLYVLTVGKTPANIAAPTSTTSYNIAGSMNGWGSGTKFNYAGDNVWHLVIELALNAEFKVQKNGSWNDGENWGYAGIQSGVGKSLFSDKNGNAKAKAKATYEIWVIPSHSDAPLYIIKK